MSQSEEEGDGLDKGASDVITPTVGGLKPVSQRCDRAARGRGQTTQHHQQKSRAATAVCASSASSAAGGDARAALRSVTAVAAGVVARGDVTVVSPAEMSPGAVSGAVA
jgi:hypothetical protein